MSMKIYNAYRLKGDYDLISLNEFCDNLRKEVTKISEQMALDWVANKTLYYYNFKKLHGSQVVQDMIKETKNSKEMHETWKLVDVDRWDSLYWNISDMAFGRNLQKSDRYYTDENGIQREVKFVKINNYLYYDDYTKAVYYQEGRAGRMVQYVGKHLKPCKYINGRVVEQKD